MARRTGRLQGGTPNRPQPFVPTPSFTHRFRFTAGSSLTRTPVTRACLLNLIEVETGMATAVRVFESIRVVDLEVWAPTTSSFASQEIAVEWNGANAPSTIRSDVSMNLAPAHVYTLPPRDSSAKWWSISGSSESEILVYLTAPSGSIVDLRVNARVIDHEAATAAEAPAGGTAGQIVYNYLDGLASGKMSPIGGVTKIV